MHSEPVSSSSSRDHTGLGIEPIRGGVNAKLDSVVKAYHHPKPASHRCCIKGWKGVIEDSIEAEEIDYFHSTLGDIAEIGLSEDPFASYALAEASKLVVGRNSALLTEMLGSRSRVLFVNPTDYGLFDAPEDLPYQLSRPSESELEEQVLKLLDMSWIEYAKQVEPVSSKFCQRSDNSLETFANILKGVI